MNKVAFSGAFVAGSLLGVGVLTVFKKNYDFDAQEEETSIKKKHSMTKDILKYGAPVRLSSVYYYVNHALGYDTEKRIPHWVAEDITANELKGAANRKHSKFKPDSLIPELFRAENSDFLGSGWSRGHMAPAGDNKHSQEAMNDSFLLSNILPQNYENNAGFWNRFEMYCRDLTKEYDHVRVISGPVMVPKLESDGKKYVKYQVIGQREVAVPTHLYKVIVAEKDSGTYKALGSFIVPNIPIPFNRQLAEFQVPLEDVESKTGFHFLPKLDRFSTKSLCEVDGCNLMERDKFELYFIGRKLESARTLQRLEKVWKELDEKKVLPDEYIKQIYERKKVEISAQKSETKAEEYRVRQIPQKCGCPVGNHKFKSGCPTNRTGCPGFFG